MRRSMMSAAMLTVCAGSAFAGPLVPERVLPDAKWVLHVDVEAIVNSNIGRMLLNGEMGAKIRAEVSEEMVREMGIDPLKDLRGVTIFGHSEEETQALVLFSATNAIDAPLARLFEIVPNYSAIREGERVVHTWRDEEETVYAYAAPGAAAGERVVLLSGNIDELRRGILRLEVGGAEVAPALKGHTPAPGSFFFVSAEQVPGLIGDDNHASAFLRYAQSVVLDVGEHGNELRATARVTASGAEDATTMLHVVQGMMALGRMAASSEPEMQPLLKIADGCRVNTDGAALVLSLSLDFATITQVIHEIEEHEQAEEPDAADAEDEAIREDLKKLDKIGKPAKKREAD